MPRFPVALFLVLSAFSLNALAHEPVYARKGMVIAQENHAADVGVAVLESGGNAIDAAVAVGFTLAVTHPYAGNLGGGGFMLIRLADGRTTFIDFRETAPAAATRDVYLDASGNVSKDSINGWRAVAVPGTVRGLELAHSRYGHKQWAELLKPAIALAANSNAPSGIARPVTSRRCSSRSVAWMTGPPSSRLR